MSTSLFCGQVMCGVYDEPESGVPVRELTVQGESRLVNRTFPDSRKLAGEGGLYKLSK